jgi:pimeloyl-ACP methyl ester carboxylesterase
MPTVEMPGELYDVGGYRLHLHCEGEGSPPVVMDSGLTASSIFWEPVLPGVAGFTRACAFDRAGYAWSDPAPPGIPRDSAQLVAELRALQKAAGISAPYVLAGLSFGGVNMLLYALRHRDEVAGLVLVDPSHPEMMSRLPGFPSQQTSRRGFQFLKALARWGLLRRFAPPLNRKLLPHWRNLAPQAWAAQLAFSALPVYYETALREAEASYAGFGQARAAPRVLGDLPLVVLTGDWWTTGRITRMKRAMLPLREEQAALSSRGRHVIVPGSSHVITVDQPQAVVEAIREVVEEARS